jgi:hypothetical protein
VTYGGKVKKEVASRFCRFLPGIGGWVDIRNGLDEVKKLKFLKFLKFRTKYQNI